VGLLVACTGEPVRVVSLTPPQDTRDTAGPYVIEAELRGELGDDQLIVCWSTDGERLRAEVTRTRDGRDDLRFAELPGQPVGTRIAYLVALVAKGAPCPAVDPSTTLLSFSVLPSSLACEVDSDCRQGVEICSGVTCRAFSGSCAGAGSCPGGYVCDESRAPAACVVPARTCTSDLACPALEQCDVGRGECVARP